MVADYECLVRCTGKVTIMAVKPHGFAIEVLTTTATRALLDPMCVCAVALSLRVGPMGASSLIWSLAPPPGRGSSVNRGGPSMLVLVSPLTSVFGMHLSG